LLAEKPVCLSGKNVYLIDASDEPAFGSKKADFRLHYCLDLFTFAMHEMKLSETKLGEKLVNFEKFDEDSVVVADRAYGTTSGIEYLRQKRADFVLRLRANAFNLYEIHDNQAKKVDLLDYFADLSDFESGSINLYYKIGEEYKPIRICATRKDAESERKGLKHLKKSNHKEKRGIVTETQSLYNKYIIAATSFGDAVPAKSVMELYRMRWQVEIAFKRLKTLFHYNEIPAKLDATAKVWFYGKLLLAAVSETLINEGRFSPSAE
jgi:IS4 transposase